MQQRGLMEVKEECLEGVSLLPSVQLLMRGRVLGFGEEGREVVLRSVALPPPLYSLF